LFHSMIGFTGAFLGLSTILLLPAAALVSFQGDQEELLQTFQPERMPTLSGEPSPMAVSQVLSHSKSLADVTRSITIMGWGDKNALAFVSTYNSEGTDESRDMGVQTHTYRLSSGKHSDTTTAFEMVGGLSGPILDTMFPLHFGSFGGLTVRIIWGLLGLSTALVAASGMMIWVERRAYGAEGKLSPENYLRLSKLTIGSCSGMVLACVSLFWLQRLAPDYILEGFFSIWLVGISLAFSLKNNHQSNRLLLGLSGVILTAVPFVDAATLEHHLFNSATGTHNHLATIDITLMLCGVLMLYIVHKLPRTRQEEQHKKSKENKEHKERSSVADEPLHDQPQTTDVFVGQSLTPAEDPL